MVVELQAKDKRIANSERPLDLLRRFFLCLKDNTFKTIAKSTYEITGHSLNENLTALGDWKLKITLPTKFFNNMAH